MLFTTLAIAALGFLFMGVVALWSPTRVTSQFGITTLDADGRNEVRGVYGGFGIAVSAALTVTLLIPQWRGAAAVAVAVALGGGWHSDASSPPSSTAISGHFRSFTARSRAVLHCFC